MPTRPPVVHVVGHSGAGKTTLIESLIAVLQRKGLRVGTAKHHHATADVPALVDRPGKDTARHAASGAQVVSLVGTGESGAVVFVKGAITLEDLLERLYADAVDLVLAEGFTTAAQLAIQVRSPDGKVRDLPAGCRVLDEVALFPDTRGFQPVVVLRIADAICEALGLGPRAADARGL